MSDKQDDHDHKAVDIPLSYAFQGFEKIRIPAKVRKYNEPSLFLTYVLKT